MVHYLLRILQYPFHLRVVLLKVDFPATQVHCPHLKGSLLAPF